MSYIARQILSTNNKRIANVSVALKEMSVNIFCRFALQVSHAVEVSFPLNTRMRVVSLVFLPLLLSEAVLFALDKLQLNLTMT